jgi:hypothetical protein
MTIQLSRIGWLPLYEELRAPNQFLTRFFSVKPGGIFRGEKVAIDVRRGGQSVAVAIKKGTGPNLNDVQAFTTKEFTPPVFGEAFPLDVNDLLARMAGVDPHTAAYEEYSAALVALMARGFQQVGDKITRSVEWQASQILQTGKLALTDKTGSINYEVDYKPKTTHFSTVSNLWSGVTYDALGDIKAMADIIRADGKVDPDRLVFGANALEKFLDDTRVRVRLDNRGMNIGMIDPALADSGATYYGDIQIGAYRFAIWAYPETYEDPATGTAAPFVGTWKVSISSSRARMDMVSAMVPLPLGPDPRLAQYIPGRMSSQSAGFDVTPNLYCTDNGKQIFGELESRPLLVPVAIDSFGCLTVG